MYWESIIGTCPIYALHIMLQYTFWNNALLIYWISIIDTLHTLETHVIIKYSVLHVMHMNTCLIIKYTIPCFTHINTCIIMKYTIPHITHINISHLSYLHTLFSSNNPFSFTQIHAASLYDFYCHFKWLDGLIWLQYWHFCSIQYGCWSIEWLHIALLQSTSIFVFQWRGQAPLPLSVSNDISGWSIGLCVTLGWYVTVYCHICPYLGTPNLILWGYSLIIYGYNSICCHNFIFATWVTWVTCENCAHVLLLLIFIYYCVNNTLTWNEQLNFKCS